MRLRGIGIWNHSRLQDAEIQVRQHLVLVGPNDVGKSSLIRCLDFLLGASTAQLYARLGAADFRDPDKPFIVQAVLDDLGDQDKALFPDEITVDPAAGTQSLTLRLEATIDQATPSTSGAPGQAPAPASSCHVTSWPAWAGR